VKFVPTEGDSERGPDFRIFAGATDFGAAWKKTARETQREYLSVKLDDPSFPAPIYGRGRGRREPQPHLVPPQRRLRPNQPRSPARERGFLMFMAAPPIRNTAIRMVGCQVLRLAHPDQILCRPPLALLPDEICLGGAAPGAAQGIADARPGRSPQPSAPRTQVRGLCRPGDPPPSRPPLHLAPPVSPTGRVAAQRCANPAT
jgi:hypothetical protein